MTQLRALDLFCGIGCASIGYAQAGFTMFGVDIMPMRRYPFNFELNDATAIPIDYLRKFDLIHASPPCQRWTAMRHAPNAKGDAHPALIEPIRGLLRAAGVPYVIENVEGAPLINPVTLCGSHFGLGFEKWQLQRHRLF